jgi:hypothetical protein
VLQENTFVMVASVQKQQRGQEQKHESVDVTVDTVSMLHPHSHFAILALPSIFGH